MPTAVVTGCNSGIGNAFAQILIDEGYEVHACDIATGPALQALQCRLHVLDVRSPDSINAFAAQLGDDKPIDLLLHVAGVMSPPEADALATLDASVLARTFETNAFGPVLLTQALLPNILRSSTINGSEGGVAVSLPPRIGIVSSRVGSIGDNSAGGSYAYRASKAAVNSFGKCLAIDLHPQGVVVSLLHPGIVRSNLNPRADVPAEAVEPVEAATKLWAVLSSKGLEDTGKFWHREGFELPW